jgi:hypothetical protein
MIARDDIAMMDDIELGQEILDLLRDNTCCADEALSILTLVIVKITLVCNLAAPSVDAHIPKLVTLLRNDSLATDEVLQ